MRPTGTLTVKPSTRGNRNGERQFVVAVIGLGYVGLPSALAFRGSGARTIGIDTSASRLNAIRSGDVDLVPEDRERLQRVQDDSDFVLTTDSALTTEADAVIICVPTPVDEHLQPETSSLRAACAAVVQQARHGQTLVLTSTSYAGSTREMLGEPLAARGHTPGATIFVASSPERVDPGNATYPVGTVPRVVGGITPECSERAARVMAMISPAVHIVSSSEAAELTKLVENSFRAVNIALANETAEICRALGLDVGEIIDAAATKPYGFMAFRPGTGVGGHCIPCDPHYLLWQLHRDRVSAPLIALAMEAIAGRPRQVVEHTIESLSADGKGLPGSRILVVGAAYKPGVRDIRESPGLAVLKTLIELGARGDYYDPLVPTALVDGTTMQSVVAPNPTDYDAIVVSTIHPGIDYGWLESAARVVDPSGERTQPSTSKSHRRSRAPVP